MYDGVVGVTGDDVVAAISGRIVAINAITAVTTDLAALGVASGPGGSEIVWSEIGTREYPEAAVFDQHLVHLVTRFEAELIDRTTGRRTALSSPEWIHAVWIDGSSWVVLEVLDEAPGGESVLERPHDGPPPDVMGFTHLCFGPRECEGPERTGSSVAWESPRGSSVSAGARSTFGGGATSSRASMGPSPWSLRWGRTLSGPSVLYASPASRALWSWSPARTTRGRSSIARELEDIAAACEERGLGSRL